MEIEKNEPVNPHFLQELQHLCKQNGTVFILDEMITGFRWHFGGAQTLYNIVPDLSTFGKAMGNGFAVSAFGRERERSWSWAACIMIRKGFFYCRRPMGPKITHWLHSWQ
nr:aminotransferase class III-fold pyridoxal phosphate-dependent enzyme [Haliscomenobacter sp.]